METCNFPIPFQTAHCNRSLHTFLSIFPFIHSPFLLLISFRYFTQTFYSFPSINSLKSSLPFHPTIHSNHSFPSFPSVNSFKPSLLFLSFHSFLQTLHSFPSMHSLKPHPSFLTFHSSIINLTFPSPSPLSSIH